LIMDFLNNIGLQEISIAAVVTILLLREILRFITGILATKGKQERRCNVMECPLAKRNEVSGTLEWFHFKRELDARLKKLEEERE